MPLAGHREVVSREFTLVGENPALDGFADMARQIKANAEQQARLHGRALPFRRSPALEASMR